MNSDMKSVRRPWTREQMSNPLNQYRQYSENKITYEGNAQAQVDKSQVGITKPPEGSRKFSRPVSEIPS